MKLGSSERNSKPAPSPRVFRQGRGQARGQRRPECAPRGGVLDLRQHVLSESLSVPGIQTRDRDRHCSDADVPRPDSSTLSPWFSSRWPRSLSKSPSDRSGRFAQSTSARRKSSRGTAPVSMARTARRRSWLISATWNSLTHRLAGEPTRHPLDSPGTDAPPTHRFRSH